MSKIVKKIRKIIPKEIRPAVPYVAAYFGGPALASKFAMNPAFAKALTAAAASKAQGDDTKTALRAAALAGAPDAISGGLGKFEQAYGFGPADVKALSSASQLTKATPMQELATIAGKGKQAIEGAGLLKTVGAQTAVEAGARAAELNEKALRDYEAQLREQGIADSAQRRAQIFGYFSRAGYDDDEVNSFLDKYGYADGGRVAFANGSNPFMRPSERGIASMRGRPMTASMRRVKNKINRVNDINIDAFEPVEDVETEELEELKQINPFIDYEKLAEAIDQDDDFNTRDFMSGLSSAREGLMSAFGRPIDMKPAPTRFGLADGGIMNLGGREMDMRGGGFIPIGAKERADDVPARLSKNEFVMTADAVRAAGDGSINKGAKRMYDLMNRLESKV